MTSKLVELNANEHANLRVVPDCAIKKVADQHLIGIKASELGQALAEFPVFLTRRNGSGKDSDSSQQEWALSAVASLEANKNTYVSSGEWLANYMPTAVRTYPLFLINAGEGKEGYSVGIDPNSDDFSEKDGKVLFSESGEPSDFLLGVTAQLDADIKNELASYHFTQALAQLNLIKEVRVLVYYEDKTARALGGLYTIDEAKLEELPEEALVALKERGFLAGLYGMLFSLYQLDVLVKRHNAIESENQIVKVQVEAAPS